MGNKNVCLSANAKNCLELLQYYEHDRMK